MPHYRNYRPEFTKNVNTQQIVING
jgi:hypothetical protein